MMLTDQKIAEKATSEAITGIHWWNDKLLTFTTTKPPGYSFLAGQYARMGIPDPSGAIWRAYSMTSSPDQDFLEFYGVIVPGGLFTTRLKEMQPGDRLLIEKQSYGFMTPDRFTDGEDLWMFATGTGIGPYISMLRDRMVWEQFRNLILVHSVRHADEFAYHDELATMQRHPPFPQALETRLHVVRAMTRETPPASDPLTLHGRITTLLEDGSLERVLARPITETRSRIMMCGNPQMIEDMRRILHHRGLRPVRRALPGQFVTENYW
ncbi:MAG TPA: ferredoxin--NADP reductase [Noviherbaspirillum sp.]